jgi:DNA-binding transcriptional MerR regulator
MSGFTIGEVSHALGVKPHIVRYWEQEVGILSPSKDRGGRRVYSMADLQLLYRIKHLVQEKHYTVRGAADQILEERSDTHADARAEIGAVRAQLLELLQKVRTDSADNKSDV